jgi:hypothetical protein
MNTMYSRLKVVGALLVALTLTVSMFGCSQDAGMEPTSTLQNPTPTTITIDHVIDVQNRHTDELMSLPGVVGTGAGMEGTTPVMYVFTSEKNLTTIPSQIEDVRTHIAYTGTITPQTSYTGTYRGAMWSGVSVGNDNEIASGTIACVVKDRKDNYYLLSNNHVFARKNLASIGEKIGQPGRFDVAGYAHAQQVATLSDFGVISYSSKGKNLVDAAIAKLTTGDFTSTTAIGAYTPAASVKSATVGMEVKKVGRTTGLTTAQVSAINVTMSCDYGSGNVARFINQIYIESNTFSWNGDSGSLIVTNDNNNNPVGLLFAGSIGSTFANPMSAVLSEFGVSIVTTQWTGQ